MKRYFLIIILLFFSCNRITQYHDGVIKFLHVGIVHHPTKPLYISTKKLDIHLDEWQIADLQRILGEKRKITSEDEMRYIDLTYNLLVTDKSSFSYVYEFILANKGYYTDDEHKNDNPTAETYIIEFNRIKFSIYYKFKDKFFNDIRMHLQAHKCDKKVINAFSSL
jgi:hypothetical protein